MFGNINFGCFDGLVSSSSFMGKLTSTTTRDTHGYLQSLKIADEWTVLEQFDTQYEASTGNLLSRQYGGPKETFTYDNLDRLVSVKAGSKETMRMDYAENGNILYKTGIGAYEYNAYDHPHAVTDVEDVDMNFPNRDLSTSFNDFGKIERIVDCKRMPPARPGRSLHRPTPHAIINFEYGPHQERWYSESILLNKRFLTTIYAGDYEKITNYGSGEAHVKEFYYLDGNTIVIKENGKFQNFLAFTDNIGSILSVIDEEGRRVFDASYDAWGRQTVTKNEIGLRRGYTGHEMLNEVGIINMNGRLYDPLLGRFLSPDNYVQAPGNSQSFNRYSYCLNNPLKYVDPSGELFGIDDAVIAFTIFNVASSMMQASFEGRNVWRAGALSLLSSAASYGIGAAFGNVGSFGNELLRAGAHGLSSGVFNALDGGSFGSSFVSGAISSGIGSYAQGVRMDPGLMLASTTAMGGVAAWVTGSDFLAGAMNGLQIGMLNHLQHGGDGGTRLRRDENGDLFGGELPEVVIRPSMNTGLALQGVLTIGSGATTFFEHNNYSRTFSHWRGKNGKLYSGLTGRGPNQYTGSRSLAMEKAMKFNKAGKVLGGINTTMSISEFGNSLINSGMTVETIGYGADAVFGTIGTFGGIKGFAIDLYYQNVMKNYSLIRMSTGRQLIDRANMMQRGFIPVGYPGRSFK